jgi:hypothetical protein
MLVDLDRWINDSAERDIMARDDGEEGMERRKRPAKELQHETPFSRPLPWPSVMRKNAADSIQDVRDSDPTPIHSRIYHQITTNHDAGLYYLIYISSLKSRRWLVM